MSIRKRTVISCDLCEKEMVVSSEDAKHYEGKGDDENDLVLTVRGDVVLVARDLCPKCMEGAVSPKTSKVYDALRVRKPRGPGRKKKGAGAGAPPPPPPPEDTADDDLDELEI